MEDVTLGRVVVQQYVSFYKALFMAKRNEITRNLPLIMVISTGYNRNVTRVNICESNIWCEKHFNINLTLSLF